MLQAVLFDWGETLCHFEWDDELLAAGHAAGLEALGRGEEAEEFTERFRAERLPALLADGAAEPLDYAGRAARAARRRRATTSSTASSTPSTRRGGRRAALVDSASRAARDAARPQAAPRRRRQHTGPSPRGSCAASCRSSASPSASTASCSSGEVGARKPAPAIFENALAQLGLDPLEAVFVGDRLVDDIAGAGGASG